MEPNLLDLEILFSCVCTLGVLYTHSPYLGVRGWSPQEMFLGCVLANSFADPWYWVNRSIFPWYLSYKRKHCNMIVYGIILYCKQSLWLCGRDCESVKRKCNGFVAGCIPSSFWTVIKGLEISLWTYPIVWVNHIIYVFLCYVFNVFFILFNDLTVYFLLLYGPVF